MKPIAFPEQNIIFGKDQPPYIPLPAFRPEGDDKGPAITCWELSEEELKKVAETGKIWVSQLTFNGPLQPIFITAEKSEIFVTPEEN